MEDVPDLEMQTADHENGDSAGKVEVQEVDQKTGDLQTATEDNESSKSFWDKISGESWDYSVLPYGLAEDEWPSIWNQTPISFLSIDGVLMCKGVLVAYMTIIVAWSTDSYWGTSNKYGTGYWLIYLTHWQVFLVYWHLWMSFGMTCFYSHVYSIGKPLTIAAKMAWSLQNICVPIVPIVVIQYWALVYEPPLHALSVHTHGVTLILLMLDLTLTYTPTYLKHAWQGATVGFIYCLFNMIYVLGGGVNEVGDHYIYSALDWKDNFGTAFATAFGVIFICTPVIYVLVTIFNFYSNTLVGIKTDMILRGGAVLSE